MHERMLNKQVVPTVSEMTEYCGEVAGLFTALNGWLSEHSDEQRIAFPYGNSYGWCVSHRKKKKLICNVFVEDNSFTVMMRLSDKQYQTVYHELHKYAQEHIDRRYPCGDGGWIHYRVTNEEQLEDIKKLLKMKM